MNFNEYINEEKESKLDEISRGNIEVSLILGRFQPIHNGHIKIIRDFLKKYPNRVLIGIVKGVKTSKDSTRNPLSFEYQRKLILDSLGDLKSKVIVYDKPLPNAYLPDIAEELRQDDYEIISVGSGADRASAYNRMIDKMNSENESVDIKYIKFPRTYESATKVRESLRSDDYERFKSLTPKSIWSQYDILKERV